MKKICKTLSAGVASMTLALAVGQSAYASSHMDAPLITLDDSANTTDVYAFVSRSEGVDYLSTAVSVYPFEDPGIGPNTFRFDDNVLYQIHVATGEDVAAGRPTLSYQFEFRTQFKNKDTILQAFLGVIEDVDDENQNLTQTYKLTKVNHKTKRRSVLGTGVVPPNNQGLVTPFYNQENDGENLAKDGVDDPAKLDRYTRQGIQYLDYDYQAFAGQRDDGFYADIQSIFDLDFTFGGPNKPLDSQGGFNVHTIALNIPMDDLGGQNQVVGVYATTSRRRILVLSDNLLRRSDRNRGRWIQVARQGNPLFNEALVALVDKDTYNRTSPEHDGFLFSQYALQPELAKILVPLLGLPENLLTNRTDLAGIFIPDLIKVDLSTGPVRLAGGGSGNPDDQGFSRLSVFGGDALISSVQAGLPGFPEGTIPGGWPNGRRFGDDVVDIAVTAVISDLRSNPLVINGPAGDRVDANDIGFNKVFPYAGTPLNGRNHGHH